MKTKDSYKLNWKLKNKIAIPIGDSKMELIEWAEWLETANRTVCLTIINNDITVSTIFLGVNYGRPGQEPILFETMIFGGDQDGFIRRYSTWEEAEKGHQETIELIFQV